MACNVYGSKALQAAKKAVRLRELLAGREHDDGRIVLLDMQLAVRARSVNSYISISEF